MQRLHIMLGLALVVTLASWVLGPAEPARAQPDSEPALRVHFNTYDLIVHSDQDWGKGEINFRLRVWQVKDGCPADTHAESCIVQLMRTRWMEYSANDDDVVKLYMSFPSSPQTGDELAPGVTSLAGIPLYAGHAYGWQIEGKENDTFSDDGLGSIYGTMTAENNWGIGKRTERAVGGKPPTGIDACVGPCPGSFSMRYEILKSERLPNLKPTSIDRLTAPGSDLDLICIGIANDGNDDAGSFRVTFQVNGATPQNGVADAGRLPRGESGQLCVAVKLPDAGPQRWEAIVDEANLVHESNEDDNRLETTRLGTVVVDSSKDTPPAPSPSPTPGPATQPDLVVRSVKVNGQVPDGKNDCKDQKNAVVAVVKNVGAAESRSHFVGLVVDDVQAEAVLQSADALEAGKEREVRFEDVRLKRGEHKLTLSVAFKGDSPESRTDNNTRTVSVTCQGGN